LSDALPRGQDWRVDILRRFANRVTTFRARDNPHIALKGQKPQPEGQPMSQTPQQPQITGKMLMYHRPELLSKDQHGKLGLARTERFFSFCSTLRAVPITIGETGLASRHYPIIFSGQKSPVPLAVLGVIDELNLFVDQKGDWDPNCYIPAYIRRYPFATAADPSSDVFAIVIDVGHEGVRVGGDVPLFENGAPTDNTNQAIEFCRNYEVERQQTEALMKALETFDLITPQSATFTPTGTGQPQPIADYFGIDTVRLQQMSNEKFLELRANGLLPMLHLALNSMSNWRDLTARRAARFGLTPDNFLTAVNLN
jgi:hypothetical protein